MTNFAHLEGFTAATDGVKLPSSPVLSADPNTFDAYDERDITATLTATSGTITLSGAANTLTQTRKGREVTLTGLLTVSAIASPTGTLAISGLTSPCGPSSKHAAAVAVQVDTFASGLNAPLMGVISPGSSIIQLFKLVNGTIAALAGDVVVGSNIRISATYVTA